MSWTHPLCDDCYQVAEPGRTPVRLLEPETVTCCGCGARTTSGIFYRRDPKTLACGGEHAKSGDPDQGRGT